MTTRQRLTGWGGTAPSVATVHRVTAEAVPDLVRRAGDRGLLARGLGRSYGDAAQNAGGDVLLLEEGPVEVDPVAATVRVSAGLSLDALIRTVLPHGLFVSVTPGTRFVSVGGAIAADIHGKNHHVDGSFGEYVDALTLVDGTGEGHRLTPEATPELFWATVGGMGLTGVITEATLRLRRVPTSSMRVDTDRAAGLGEALALMRDGADQHTYSVAWIDLLATGAALGRAVLTRGEHAEPAELGAVRRGDPLAFSARQRLRAPARVPSGLVNPWSVRAFNELWFRKAPQHRRGEVQSLAAFFHPLDGVGGWNRLYGPRGLVQYQLVVPLEAEAALTEVVRRTAAAGQASFLAVLKRFGPGSPGLLSFPTAGWTLALDLPAAPRLGGLLDDLDRLVLEAGGRLYLAKDARARPETLAAMYPRLPEFRAVRRRLDPDGVFTSDLARRLHL